MPKETYGNYERGDRVPDSEFLALLREKTGVDLNWLATGKDAPAPARAPAGVAAEALLAKIQELFATEPEWPLPEARRRALQPQRAQLAAIALDESQPDRTRALADRHLRMAFDDPDAARRAEAQGRRGAMKRRAAVIRVEDVLASAGREPSREIKLALEHLAMEYDVSAESLRLLVAALLGEFTLEPAPPSTDP